MTSSDAPSTWPVPNMLINLNGTRISQLDICSQYLVLSSQKHKVYLFHFEHGHCFQIGAKSTNKCMVNLEKSQQKNVSHSGVCILALSANKRKSSEAHHLINLENEDAFGDQEEIKYKTYVTRPKCRLWEVEENGDIEYTHQYYKLVSQTNSNNSFSLISGG